MWEFCVVMSVGFFHSEMLRVDYRQKGFLFTYNHFHPHFTFVFQPLLLDPALVFSLQYYIFTDSVDAFLAACVTERLR